MIKKITVVGGGNIGTQFACICAAKGYETVIFSSKPECYDGSIEIVDCCSRVTCSGNISFATDDISKALCDTDLIFVTYPAYMFEDFSNIVYPYIKKGTYIGIIPGVGGAEFAFKKCIDVGAIMFGLQRVPSVARLVEYGKKVRVEGKRDKLFLGSIPTANAEKLATFMAKLFDMPVDVLPNYLCVTMTPSNPILHTIRLCTMFYDYSCGKVYDRNPLFYGEWDDASSELLLKCDYEHQKILKAIAKLDLTSVTSLKIHYQSNTVQQLTNKLREIKSLNSILSPMKNFENGWIPDFESRYFKADFSYGLSIIKEIANIVDVDVPNIEDTLLWYQKVTGNQKCFMIENYNVKNVDDIYAIYQKV